VSALTIFANFCACTHVCVYFRQLDCPAYKTYHDHDPLRLAFFYVVCNRIESPALQRYGRDGLINGRRLLLAHFGESSLAFAPVFILSFAFALAFVVAIFAPTYALGELLVAVLVLAAYGCGKLEVLRCFNGDSLKDTRQKDSRGEALEFSARACITAELGWPPLFPHAAAGTRGWAVASMPKASIVNGHSTRRMRRNGVKGAPGNSATSLGAGGKKERDGE
jgi:hypothetical protein